MTGHALSNKPLKLADMPQVPCSCIERLHPDALGRIYPRRGQVCGVCEMWTGDLGAQTTWGEVADEIDLLCTAASEAGLNCYYYADGVIPEPDDGSDTERDNAINLAFYADAERQLGLDAPADLGGWNRTSVTAGWHRAHLAAFRRTLAARGFDWTVLCQNAWPLTRAEANMRRRLWMTPAEMALAPTVPWALYGGETHEDADPQRLLGVLSAALLNSSVLTTVAVELMGAISSARSEIWRAFLSELGKQLRLHLIYSTVGHKNDLDAGLLLLGDRPIVAFRVGETSDPITQIGILDDQTWAELIEVAAANVNIRHVLPVKLLEEEHVNWHSREVAEGHITLDTPFMRRIYPPLCG